MFSKELVFVLKHPDFDYLIAPNEMDDEWSVCISLPTAIQNRYQMECFSGKTLEEAVHRAYQVVGPKQLLLAI